MSTSLEPTPDPDHPNIWRVPSRNNKNVYRVQFIDEYVTCTCIHGQNNPGEARCYHVALAEEENQRLKALPQADPSPLPAPTPKELLDRFLVDLGPESDLPPPFIFTDEEE